MTEEDSEEGSTTIENNRLDVSLGLKSVAALSLVLGIAIGTLGGSIGTLVATDTIGDSDITFLESEVDDIPRRKRRGSTSRRRRRDSRTI